MNKRLFKYNGMTEESYAKYTIGFKRTNHIVKVDSEEVSGPLGPENNLQ